MPKMSKGDIKIEILQVRHGCWVDTPHIAAQEVQCTQCLWPSKGDLKRLLLCYYVDKETENTHQHLRTCYSSTYACWLFRHKVITICLHSLAELKPNIDMGSNCQNTEDNWCYLYGLFSVYSSWCFSDGQSEWVPCCKSQKPDWSLWNRCKRCQMLTFLFQHVLLRQSK